MTRHPTRRKSHHVALALLRTAEFAATAALVTVCLPLWLLPRRAALVLGKAYGVVAGVGWPPARRVAMINLRRVYGATMTRRTARRLTWRVFGNLGMSIAEGLQFARRIRRDRSCWESTYEPEDPALEQSIIDDPRPKVFVTGHLGSWEVAIMLAGLRVGVGGAAIARRIDNPFLDAVVRHIRWSHDDQWIAKRGAVSAALARLEAGHSVAMLLDESAGRRGVFVDFLGRPASTSKMAALLSLKTGAPIVIGAAIRRPGSARPLYRLAIVEPRLEASDPVHDLTDRVTRIWGAWILNDPLQWRWIHWRWRHRPDGSEETYTRRDLRECFAATPETVASHPGIQEQT